MKQNLLLDFDKQTGYLIWANEWKTNKQKPQRKVGFAVPVGLEEQLKVSDKTDKYLDLVILFTNPTARAGYDTRSIFKRSLTGLNSEFSFF